MNLTLPQVKLMEKLAKRRLSYSPMEVLAFDNGEKVSWITVRALKKKGLVTNYDIHPWGPDPVYMVSV